MVKLSKALLLHIGRQSAHQAFKAQSWYVEISSVAALVMKVLDLG